MRIAVATTLVAIALGCSNKADPDAAAGSRQAAPPAIYTVNYPLSYFAERMAPAGARVVFPVPGGIDPAFWEPSADAVREYQQAAVIVLNGAGYARWTRYATLPRARIVVTADGCREGYLRAQQGIRHQHGPEGAHAHTDLAFTTWLDLRLAACQASSVRDALVERFPEEKETISSEFEALARDLLDIDEQLQNVGKAFGDRPLLASHPVYQYLANAYGLSIQSLHLEPDQTLSNDDWKDVDAMLKQHRAKWMLWEAPPREATEAGFLERGVTPIVFDPGAQRPSKGDFMSVMQTNAARLECMTGGMACR